MTDNERQLNERIVGLESKLDVLLSIVSGNSFATNCKYTFAEWLFRWMDLYKKPKQDAETFEQNMRRINNEIIPALGDIKLSDLTTDSIQGFVNSYPVSNARDKLCHIFSGSLRKAYDLGYIIRDPFRAVEKKKSQSEHFPVLQPKTQLKLYKLITVPKYLQYFIFYCCTGFRTSEGLSINPLTDIDRKRQVITLTMQDKSTKKHKREVPYLLELFDGFDLTRDKLFPDITANSVKLYFGKLFKKHNIDAVPHSFRHTFISCCYYVGIPEKYIQKWVGHSSILMTMDTYTHIITGKSTPIIEYLKRLKNKLKI